MTAWINLFVCASFACRLAPPIPGDGMYYATKAECVWSAKRMAVKMRLRRMWEAECVEREVGK